MIKIALCTFSVTETMLNTEQKKYDHNIMGHVSYEKMSHYMKKQHLKFYNVNYFIIIMSIIYREVKVKASIGNLI